ncbi:MAG: hypothetical protein BJ554DRAFT_3662 [Olpidium bornovanus]|uniref:Uncharacterized protein n=1 Tax=Olpidium bornovanus TaxID=278681 RepID=A0A8H7ZNE1_9FUNG|nr:MAG: hypothetical protein BJ554DRAFT_3662 [Olpidium bornovanus]
MPLDVVPSRPLLPVLPVSVCRLPTFVFRDSRSRQGSLVKFTQPLGSRLRKLLDHEWPKTGIAQTFRSGLKVEGMVRPSRGVYANYSV